LRTYLKAGFQEGDVHAAESPKYRIGRLAPLSRKGMAVLQLPNGGFDVVSFDPRTLQIKS
jgi:hypothetical protein